MRFVPVRWIMRNRFPSSDYIADYTGPLLQLHGEADSIVPMKIRSPPFRCSALGSKALAPGTRA